MFSCLEGGKIIVKVSDFLSSACILSMAAPEGRGIWRSDSGHSSHLHSSVLISVGLGSVQRKTAVSKTLTGSFTVVSQMVSGKEANRHGCSFWIWIQTSQKLGNVPFWGLPEPWKGYWKNQYTLRFSSPDPWEGRDSTKMCLWPWGLASLQSYTLKQAHKQLLCVIVRMLGFQYADQLGQ